jgi:membrane protease YdiL (CAAX protease family)
MDILSQSGTLLSTVIIASSVAGILSLLLFVRIRKTLSIKDYLSLKSVTWKAVAFWMVVTVLFVVGSDGLSRLIGHTIVPDFWVNQLRISSSVLLLYLGVIFIGPVFEELLFRGFMFTGLSASGLGVPGAVFITALIWAVIHFYYDLYGIATIFVLGIMLGIARALTGSLYLTTVMHASINAIAMVQASLHLD